MKNALTIAAREFEEKRFVAYTAVAFAVMPFLVVLIPGVSSRSPRESIAFASMIFATGFTVALAVMAGINIVSRDLSDGRMSFYFSRPVASASIWFGKLTAGVLMVVGCFGLMIAPAWLVTDRNWTSFSSVTLAQGTIAVPAFSLALLLVAHVIGTFTRSRSPLIVFDFAAAAVCALAMSFLAFQLLRGQAVVLASRLGVSLAIALVLAIVAGGAWQLARGRTDRRRNHLALSQAIWGTMAVALLIVAGYVAWVVSVKPGDITVDFRANRSTGGPFAVITGKTPGRGDYRAGFLLNTEDGTVTRVSSYADWFVRYTRDGRSAVIPIAESNMHPANLLIYRKGMREPIDSGLSYPLGGGGFSVSDDGGRLATISREGVLSIYDVAQKRSLASVKLPASKYVSAFFLSPDVLRLYLNNGAGTTIGEVDVRSTGLRETGFVATKTYTLLYPDSSVSRMLVRPERGVVTLNDARTGALITTLVSGTQVQTARFLRDGRIAVVDGPQSAAVLHILSAGGVLEHDVPLGPSRETIFIGDDGMRVVLFSLLSPGHNELIAANLSRGVIERRKTVPCWVPSGMVDPQPPIEPLRDVFYGDANGHMVAWNPATGAIRPTT